MAREKYDPNQSIHSMTTRQLRQFIADQAKDAEQRLKTVNLDNTSKAFKDAALGISYTNGKVIKSTSNMTKAEMRELAYKFRDFTSLDTFSGYAESIDWKENKKKYQTFIKKRVEDGDDFWKQFITEKGNVSKKGYSDYKQYIEFLKSVQEVKSEYGYKQLKTYARQTLEDPKRARDIARIMTKLVEESKGKSWTQGDLITKFELAVKKYDQDRKKHLTAIEAQYDFNIPKVKNSSKKSTTKIPVKQGRKLKEHGSVRRTSS